MVLGLSIIKLNYSKRNLHDEMRQATLKKITTMAVHLEEGNIGGEEEGEVAHRGELLVAGKQGIRAVEDKERIQDKQEEPGSLLGMAGNLAFGGRGKADRAWGSRQQVSMANEGWKGHPRTDSVQAAEAVARWLGHLHKDWVPVSLMWC